jgi:long-subunit acyl-CoA synthetase (AMP-forming)
MLGGAIRYLWTGSAAAPLEMLRFFTELGLPIYEGYGLNETCIVSKNYPGANKIGSVGRLLSNKEVTFDEQGQILVRSRNPVNIGYAYCEEGESERMFGKDGTVYTGDVGHLDEQGFLYISGRVNDLIVLTSGKNVFPQRVEDAINAALAVEHCMVYGHGKPHLVAVVVPRERAAPRERLERDLADVNRNLAPQEKVGAIVIATESFTRENGLLTSQYKMRRKWIADKYKDALEACYTQST